MQQSPKAPIPDERALTSSEREVTRWMLEHGEVDPAPFLSHLSRARVISRCPCGCASVDFAIEGESRPTGGIKILGDFLYGPESAPQGIFVFERNGVLAGIEVWSPTGIETATVLPDVNELRRWEDSTVSEDAVHLHKRPNTR